MAVAAAEKGRARRRATLRGLWGHPDFLRLWAAQTVSLLGSETTLLALPLAAALTLGASPLEMGLLAAAGQSPFLLVSLPAGVWVDRVRRRPLLVAADLGRALLLGSVPAAALLGALRIEQLYAVAFAAGVLSVVFEVAHYAYVPALIGKDRLLEGNGKLQVSYSVAESTGPGIAGALVQLASAPFAVLVDAVSFVASVLLLRGIDAPEPTPGPAPDQPLRTQVTEGLRSLLDHPLLRPIVLASAATELCAKAVLAVYVLYATRDLGLAPGALGLVFAAGGVGAVPGALLAGRVAGRVGAGPAIVGGWLVAALALLAVPMASGPAAAATLAAGQLVAGVAGTIANVNQWSLRQRVTPDRLHGRVTASHRFLVYGAYPLGSLLGGALASAIGPRDSLLLCALGATLGPLWAWTTPLRSLRDPPSPAGS